MGPLAFIRAFSDRYQGESIEHSLKLTEILNFKLAAPAAVAPYRNAATGQGHRACGPLKL